MFPTARELPGHLRLFTDGAVWRLEWTYHGELAYFPYGVIAQGKFIHKSDLMTAVLS